MLSSSVFHDPHVYKNISLRHKKTPLQMDIDMVWISYSCDI